MTVLCKTFRKQAGFAWSRMRNGASIIMPLSEETLTETLLYEIAWAHKADPGFRVRVATKPEESLHGGDWELWLTQGGKGIKFRVQAKRLYPNGRYKSLFSYGKDAYGNAVDLHLQTKKLIASAKLDNSIPLYCFYNFDGGHISDWPRIQCPHKHRGASYWGCSVATASDILAANSNELKKLLPLMTPWHKMVCVKPSSRLPDAAVDILGTKIKDDNLSEFLKEISIPEYVHRILGFELAGEDSSYLDFETLRIDRGERDGISGVCVIDDRRKQKTHIRPNN